MDETDDDDNTDYELAALCDEAVHSGHLDLGSR